MEDKKYHKTKLRNTFQNNLNPHLSKPSYLITTNPDRFLQNSNRKAAMIIKDRDEMNPEMAEVVQKILLKRKKEKKNINNNNNSMIKSRKVDSMKKYFDNIYNKKHALNKEKYYKLNKSSIFDSLHDRMSSEDPHINYLDYINKAPNKSNNKIVKKNKINISCNNNSKKSRNVNQNLGIYKTIKNDNNTTVIKRLTKKLNNNKNNYIDNDNDNDNEYGHNNKLSSSINLDDYEECCPKNVKKIKIIKNNQYILNLNSITIDLDQINKDKNLMEINCSSLEDKIINSSKFANNKKMQNHIILQQIKKNLSDDIIDDISIKNVSKETSSTKNSLLSDKKLLDNKNNNMKNKLMNVEKKNIFNNFNLKIKQKETNKNNKNNNNNNKILNNILDLKNKNNLNKQMNDNQFNNHFNMTINNGFYKGNLNNMNKVYNNNIYNKDNKKIKININKAQQKENNTKNILNSSLKNDKLKVKKELNNKKINKNKVNNKNNNNNKKTFNVHVKIKDTPNHSKNGTDILTERAVNIRKKPKLTTNNISDYDNCAPNRSFSIDYFKTEQNINKNNKKNYPFNEGISMSNSNKNNLIKAKFNKYKDIEKEKCIRNNKSLDRYLSKKNNISSDKIDALNTNVQKVNKKNTKKEYPNMAQFYNGNKNYTEIIDEEEKLLKNRETKAVNLIESLCKKGFSGPGVKKTNQDNFFIYNNFNNNSNYIYLGVCDGHGLFGQDISTYLVNKLPQNMNNIIISRGIKNLSTEKISILSDVFQETFIKTNILLNEDERIDSSFSGSTCVSVLFTPTRIFCINVGDSRCIIGKNNGNEWSSKVLSRDHKPSEPDEMNRIIKNGGRIESFRDNFGNFVGPERVWNREGDGPGLAMSRSFGDEIAHKIGVIVDPEITEYFFLKEDKFIVLGSDGIWEFISNDEVVEIVKDYYLQDNIEGAIEYLYKEASKRWIMEEEVIDDITIIIIFLK